MFSVLFLVVGSVCALTLSDSTISVGTGYDFFSGNGKALSDASEFKSGITSASLYGCYDVKVGNRLYSRIEYCLYVFTRSFDYGSNYKDINPLLKEGKSNKRVGGFIAIYIGRKGHLNLGGAVADISLKLTDTETGDVHSRRFVGVGLILEGQFDFNDHFSLRLGVSPDYLFFSLDTCEHSEDGGYSTTERRGAFSKGYSIGARLGVAYKF